MPLTLARARGHASAAALRSGPVLDGQRQPRRQPQGPRNHPAIHGVYFTEVARRLEPLVTGNAQCGIVAPRVEMQAIKGLLERDKFPYKPGDQEPVDPDD